MYNSNIPNDRELPTTKKLVRSTIIAAVSALVLLVTVVMPAEYGIDLTGMGRVLGLKQMGEIKMSLAAEASDEAVLQEQMANGTEVMEPEIRIVTPAEAAAPAVEPAAAATPAKTDEMSVTLAPNEGAEVKVAMLKGQTVVYNWTSTGKTNFDVHADSKDVDYHNYSKGSKTEEQGSIEAAFDGNHGWFWRNRTGDPVTVTLRTEGEYSEIKRVK